MVSLILIRWIVIYPVDSAIQRLNNRALNVIMVIMDRFQTNSLAPCRKPSLLGKRPLRRGVRRKSCIRRLLLRYMHSPDRLLLRYMHSPGRLLLRYMHSSDRLLLRYMHSSDRLPLRYMHSSDNSHAKFHTEIIRIVYSK